jgi:hypothetical protein
MAGLPGNHSDSGFDIPRALYDKARDHQDQLTDAERQRFLSRGDVVAKALGSPDSLTTEEIHQACGWPSPDVVRANIQHASGGSLSTPAELFAKVKGALENGQFDTAVTGEEACLIAHNFRAGEDWGREWQTESHSIPGYGHALTLLTRRLGSDITIFKACGSRSFEVRRLPGSGPPPSPAASMAVEDRARRRRAACRLANDMASVQDQVQRGVISEQDFFARVRSIQADMLAIDTSDLATKYTPLPNDPFQLIPAGTPLPSLYDRFGSGPWPDSHRSVGAFDLFHQDTGFSGSDSANRAVQLWATLPEDQKDPYRIRAEAKRREAWAEYETRLTEYETRLARQDANPNAVSPLSAFQLFRNDQVAASNGGVGFGEVLARWEALTDEQRGLYERRAWADK